MTMTDPFTGSRTFKAQTARMALAEFEDWTADRGKYADPDRQLAMPAVAGLANAAEWLLEIYDAEPGPEAAAALTGQANAGVAYLDTRGLRDVLNVLALRNPAAVIAAIAEAGHGRA